MTEPNDEQELAQLRATLQAADPALQSPAPPDTWIHDLTEATMTSAPDTDQSTPAKTPAKTPHKTPPRRTWMLVAAAAVIVGALGIGSVVAQQGSDDRTPPTATVGHPTVTQLQAPAASTAKCMVPSAEVLSASAETAFDGSVVSIAGDQVRMEPTHWYAGEPTDQVVVTAPAEVMQSLIGAVDLKVGERYLLAGSSDGHLMVCGLSAPYDADLAALYATAFAE